MLQNARVTAFSVFELLRESQLRGGGGVGTMPGAPPPPPTEIRVKKYGKYFSVIRFGNTPKIEKLTLTTFPKNHANSFIILILLKDTLNQPTFQRRINMLFQRSGSTLKQR